MISADLFFVLLGLGLILLAEELSWKKKILTDEGQRKFGHIALGVFTALWPWLLSWNQIKLLGALAIVFTLVNYYTKLFHYLGLVKRGGYGDIFFALAIVGCAFLTTSKVFFALAILNLAIADGLAALVGKHWGRDSSYKIFGQTKSLVGTMAFWVASLLIVGIVGVAAHNDISYHTYFLALVWLPPILAVLENFSLLGIDNLTVPIAAVLFLRLIT